MHSSISISYIERSPKETELNHLKGNHSIEGLLFEFTREISTILDSIRDDTHLIRESVPHERTEVSELRYDKGLIGQTTTQSLVERERLFWKDQFSIVDNRIKILANYENALEKMASFYQKSIDWAEFQLRQFIHFIVTQGVRSLSDDFLIQTVVHFIRLLDESPRFWSVKIWLEGVWLEDESYEISKRLVLRRPNPKDFEYERPVWPRYITTEPTRSAPAIIEFKIRKRQQYEVQEEVDVLLSVLRLFRVGSVDSYYSEYHSDMPFFGGSFSTPRNLSARIRYKFGKSDIPLFQAFNEKLQQIAPSRMRIDRVTIKDPAVSVAFQRYNDAILGSGSPGPVE